MIVQPTATAGAWLDAEATVLAHAAVRQHIEATLAVGASPDPRARALLHALAPVVDAIAQHRADEAAAARRASFSASFSASFVAAGMKPSEDDPGWLDTKAAGHELGVSPSQVAAWVRCGELRGVGGGRRGRPWRIDPASVEALKQRRAAHADHPR